MTVFCLYFIKITVLYMQTNTNLWTFLAQFFAEWEMFQTQVAEKIKTHFVFKNFFFFFNSCVCEIIWKHTVEPNRPQMAIWCVRIARWMNKATDTHLEYVIIVAFLLHQWSHDRASMLRHSCIACPRYSCHILNKLENFDRFLKNATISN